ncbi:hypothetical protein E2C01_073866 [Portunus trituberculatus]|uniref:Uncharacterized protein n=1 Tax=Portunus trituberculatus TaxID=210409 RepID=A0A5B7IAL8_PORTR|nr:hypothetical protein [Portunus trituberculatus]
MVSNSTTSSVHLTSSQVSHHVVERQLLNESGIRRALELTVSTIIESEDSDVLGSYTDIGGSTTEGEDIPPPPAAAPIPRALDPIRRKVTYTDDTTSFNL